MQKQNKTIIISIIIFLIAIGIVNAADIIMDSKGGATTDYSAILVNTKSLTSCFTATQTYEADKINISLMKDGNPTMTIWVVLYNDSDNNCDPEEAQILANSTPLDTSTLPGVRTEIEWQMLTNFSIDEGYNYSIVIESQVHDAANSWKVAVDDTIGAGYREVNYNNGDGTWTQYAGGATFTFKTILQNITGGGATSNNLSIGAYNRYNNSYIKEFNISLKSSSRIITNSDNYNLGELGGTGTFGTEAFIRDNNYGTGSGATSGLAFRIVSIPKIQGLDEAFIDIQIGALASPILTKIPEICLQENTTHINIRLLSNASPQFSTVECREDSDSWRTLQNSSGNKVIDDTRFYQKINTTLNTSNGVINTLIPNSNSTLFNITLFSTNYFNVTLLNQNISSDLNISMFQSQVNISVNKSIFNTKIFNYSIFLNGILRVNLTNTTEEYAIIYPNIGNYNATIHDETGQENYIMNIDNFNISALENKSVEISIFTRNIIINATDIISNTAITTFTVTIESNNVSYQVNTSTTTGTAITPVVDGSYNVTLDAPGYPLTNNTVTIDVNTTQQNFTYQFNIYTLNSLNITFRNSQDLSLVNDRTVSIQFIGATSQTNTTSTGHLYVDLLTPSEYTLLYDAIGYRQGSYIFTLINRTFNHLTLYMELENQTSLALITVQDKFSKDPIRDSIVTIQRYENNSWITDQIIKTDFNGQAEAYFVVSTVFYNFLVEVGGTTYFGTINSNADKKKIYAEDITNGIVVEIDRNPNTIIPNYQSTYGIATSIRFENTTNTTGQFIFTYDDPDNIPHQGQLKCYKNGVLVTTTSASTESASMNCQVNTTGNEGIVSYTAYGLLDGIVVEQSSGRLGIDPEINFNWGVAGYILAFFITLIGFTTFAVIPSLAVISGSAVFSILIFFNVIFRGADFAVIPLLLFTGFIIGRVRSKSGVNS